MSDRPENKRSAPRYTVIMDAEITDLLTRTNMKLRSSDISVTGCYIDALNPLERGTPVSLRLIHDSQVFESKGVVAYTVARLGMGVNFDQPVHKDQLATLCKWISQAEDDAAAAQGKSLGTRVSS